MKSKTISALAISAMLCLSGLTAFAVEKKTTGTNAKTASKAKAYRPPAFPFRKPGTPMDAPKLPDNALDAWNKGEAAFRALDFKGAVEQFQAVVDANPTYSRGYERLGSAQAASDDYDAALKSLNKAVELDQKDYLPHLVLGRVILVKIGEQAGTVEAQRAYDINPWECAGFLDFANQDRFDEHKWFVLANYWKEMEADVRAAAQKKPATMMRAQKKETEPCCDACAKKGMMGSPEDCAKAKAKEAANAGTSKSETR
ncbi:MAG TPA: tetratricopeptide repeat protein [Oculatellaceae cyanobacterium]